MTLEDFFDLWDLNECGDEHYISVYQNSIDNDEAIFTFSINSNPGFISGKITDAKVLNFWHRDNTMCVTIDI